MFRIHESSLSHESGPHTNMSPPLHMRLDPTIHVKRTHVSEI